MKQIDFDSYEEQKILINCITNTEFLTSIIPLLKIEFFDSSYSKTVIKWVIDYYNRYKEAPKKNIEDIFIQNKSSIGNEETIELIGKFLLNLNNLSKNNNLLYSLEQAEKWIKLQYIKKIKENLEDCIIEGNIDKAENVLISFERIKIPNGNGVFLLNDKNEILNAFLKEEEYLFSFRGALGELVGSFTRGDLVSFLAFTNKGKTWWQLFSGYEAVTNGLNVVFFTLEMTLTQMIRRAWQCFTGQAMNDEKVRIPFFRYNEKIKKYDIEFVDKQVKKIDLENIDKYQKKFRFQFRGGDMVIHSFPAFSSTVNDIEIFLNNLEYYDNFIADVIIIDYADIIKPDSFRNEYRHQLDNIWKQLRSLAQKKNAVVITATQSSRAGALKDVSETEVAEDIRKLNHCSKMIVLNQTKEEQENGIVRVKEIKKRNERRDFREVAVLQCLDIGRVYLDSKFLNEINFKFIRNNDD